MQAALNEVDEAIAMGRARPVVWLGPFLCIEDNRASAEEEVAWRAAFVVPSHEFLVRVLSCSLLDKKELAGELFVGSHSLHFKSRMKLPDQYGGKERESRVLTVAYNRIVSFAKRPGKLPGRPAAWCDGAPRGSGGFRYEGSKSSKKPQELQEARRGPKSPKRPRTLPSAEPKHCY